jgi:hypothetical protein
MKYGKRNILKLIFFPFLLFSGDQFTEAKFFVQLSNVKADLAENSCQELATLFSGRRATGR